MLEPAPAAAALLELSVFACCRKLVPAEDPPLMPVTLPAVPPVAVLTPAGSHVQFRIPHLKWHDLPDRSVCEHVPALLVSQKRKGQALL
jgi:hypothetical protein